MVLERFSGTLTTAKMKVLVYGWYGKGNLGDDLFVDAFQYIFPDYQFTFTDKIKLSQLTNCDAVFIGGGSFLGECCQIASDAIETLKTKPIFYLGVGPETSIHPTHQELIKLAKLIAIRSQSNLDSIQELNPRVIVIPDIVYSLPVKINFLKKPRSILYIPNISVVPKWDSPHWKHTSWDYFKIEMAQALDTLAKSNYEIKFLPFCTNDKMNDAFTAGEIINRMVYSTKGMCLPQPTSLSEVIDTISQYELVVTQRFHGTILANMAQTNCLTIHHHDKLKNSEGSKVSYYACNKNMLLEHIILMLNHKTESVLPIDRDIFVSLKEKVENALCRGREQ